MIMEVTTNNTVNEPQQEEQTTMSEFCEAVLGATSNFNEKATDSDVCIMICGDGKRIATRLQGSYPHALHVLVSLMDGNENIAELFTEACMIFSNKLLGRRINKEQTEQN